MDEAVPVVFDNGTHMVKVGNGGDDSPRGMVDPVVGTLRDSSLAIQYRSYYVGEEATLKRGVLTLSRPIEAGLVKDWDAMEKIWHHCYKHELNFLPEEHPVLMGEKCWTPQRDREKAAQIMFEKFGVPSFALASDATLALYSCGRMTGLSVNMGEDMMSATAVYEGHPLVYTTTQVPCGGKHAVDYLNQLLGKRYNLGSHTEAMTMTRDIMEKLCSVVIDIEGAIQEQACDSFHEKYYDLPWDGGGYHLGIERFLCPEVFFAPSKYMPSLSTLPASSSSSPPSCSGLIEMIQDCIGRTVQERPPSVPTGGEFLFSRLPNELLGQITKSFPPPLSLTKEMYKNITLTGGASLFEGMQQRILYDLQRNLAAGPNSARVTEVKVIAPPERKCSIWIGGSILSSIESMFNPISISSAEYLEVGPSIVQYKCIS